MKSFKTIAMEASAKDFHVVAEIANCSRKNVQLVVQQKRGDHFNVQLIFSDYLMLKEDLKKKYRKRPKQPDNRKAKI